MKIFISLKKEGNGFIFSNITQEKAAEINPVLEQMFLANDKQDVVIALIAFKAIVKKDNGNNFFLGSRIYQINSDGTRVSIELNHQHNPTYPLHSDAKCKAHNDSIETMIAFVNDLMDEEVNNPVQNVEKNASSSGCVIF